MLFTADPRAVNHILTHADVFQKPTDAKASDLLGEGTHSIPNIGSGGIIHLPYKALSLLRVKGIANR